jgi:hypothetical protein
MRMGILLLSFTFPWRGKVATRSVAVLFTLSTCNTKVIRIANGNCDYRKSYIMDAKIEVIEVETKRLSNADVMERWAEIGNSVSNAVHDTDELLDALKKASRMQCELCDELHCRQHGDQRPF